MEEKEYVLGTHEAEIDRLGLQHRMWSSYAFKLWEEAGFGPGQNLLDVGCGPGFTTRDLALWAGSQGKVTGIDVSQRFLKFSQNYPKARDAAPIEYLEMDVQRIDLSPNSMDGAYARWVYFVVPTPEKSLEGVYRALRPGKPFVIQDYLHYPAFTLIPSSKTFTRVIQAVCANLADQGADPQVAAKLEILLERQGFTVRKFSPYIRIARPTTDLWRWPDSFFKTFCPTLVERGYLTNSEKEAFFADWEAYSKNPNSILITAVMTDIIATKQT